MKAGYNSLSRSGISCSQTAIKSSRQNWETFDVYDFRGDKLKDKIESYLCEGDIAAMLYSNPNNPSWICFTEKELKIIAELADKYNVVVHRRPRLCSNGFQKGSLSSRQSTVPGNCCKIHR